MRKRFLTSLTTIVTFLALQSAALLDANSHTHIFVDGQWAHASLTQTITPQTTCREQSPAKKDLSDPELCALYASLINPSSAHLEVQHVSTLTAPPALTHEVPLQLSAHFKNELYRLAPKNSPPTLA